MEVYSVTADDVIYFRTIKEAREDAKKFLAEYNAEFVQIWKCADYDSEDWEWRFPYEVIYP